MPEEATRKLLKLFGIAVTDFEDQSKLLLQRMGDPGWPPQASGATLELAEQWLKVHGEVMARWMEVTRLLLETQAEVQAEVARAIASARRPSGEVAPGSPA